MYDDLRGKSVLITGGGGDIGRVTALAYAKAGAKLIISDVSEEAGQATAAAAKAAGAQDARFVAADVTKDADVTALVAAAVAAYGRLDCAFNNAGLGGTMFVQAADYQEAVWDQVIGVNLKGVWLCVKHELRQMLAQGGGAIVNTASVAGLIGSRVGVAYIASKHGVVGLTKASAVEVAGRNIRINAVCPSWIPTNMTNQYMERDAELEERMMVRQPGGRLCTSEEVAEAVLWLSSDAASFVTGHALAVDGGLVVQ